MYDCRWNASLCLRGLCQILIFKYLKKRLDELGTTSASNLNVNQSVTQRTSCHIFLLDTYIPRFLRVILNSKPRISLLISQSKAPNDPHRPRSCLMPFETFSMLRSGGIYITFSKLHQKPQSSPNIYKFGETGDYTFCDVLKPLQMWALNEK